ncbi:sulfite exporter TauE/SafE family protein [Rhodococcus sp. IEGM 1351]|uniref:sulfite exporter TauE/SafE family protein n=1 Tax=Rhodococcus sp. IEGM 1351 TaxID=3047089 RepID=UPI0024B6F14A|nr:sulfite exporter TauE/SafE family protein [Rhodococcus sp. IEGM 1351]MDI9938866.1 sulfite exporter TauE/SafE family protein [Rhodococcus sp. IEGM 1351]
MTVVLALTLGAVIGILLGLLGGGGSILAVPGLVYGLGIPLDQAVPMSLLVIGVASLFGAVPKIRAGQIQWRVMAVFAGTGVVAAFAGSAVNRLLPPAVTLGGFAVVMIASAIRMLSSTESVGTACRADGASAIDWRRCTSRSVPAGLGVGFLTGLFGVGGGFLIIPALVLLLGVQMAVAVGTSLLIVAVNSGAGLIAYLGHLRLDWALVAVFTVTAVGGSLLAGRYGGHVDKARLQRWFAVLIFAVAGFVLIEVLALR